MMEHGAGLRVRLPSRALIEEHLREAWEAWGARHPEAGWSAVETAPPFGWRSVYRELAQRGSGRARCRPSSGRPCERRLEIAVSRLKLDAPALAEELRAEFAPAHGPPCQA
jgi:hypothetical protein